MKKLFVAIALLFAGATSAAVVPTEDMGVPLPESVFHIMIQEDMAIECVPVNQYNKYICYFVLPDTKES